MKSITRSLLVSAALAASAGLALADGASAGIDATTTNTYGSGYGNISHDSGYGSESSNGPVTSAPLMSSGDMTVDTQTLGAGPLDLRSSSSLGTTTISSSTHVLGSSGLSNSQMRDLARNSMLR